MYNVYTVYSSVGLRKRPAVVSLPLGPDCSLFRVIENLCHIGRKQELRQKGDIGASLPPSCDMSGVTRRGGGTARAQHWAGKRKPTPHPVAVATWGRPVRFSLWSRWYAWSALRLTGISQLVALLLISRPFVLRRTRWASSNKNKRKISTNKWKQIITIKRKLGKLEKMLLLLSGESSMP